MRKNLLVAALLTTAIGVYAQGTINFNNRLTSGTPPDQAAIVAPIFGVDPACPSCTKSGNPTATWFGNTAAGPAPVPVGTQVYGGAPLTGTGYTVQLWGANVTAADSALQLLSTTTFSTRTTTASQNTFAGFIQNPAVNPGVPGVVGGTTDRAKFEIRVWDNKGGTVTSWDQALSLRASVAQGTSGIFTIDSPLGVGSVLPPTLYNLRSFQLSIVPEPSVIALGVLGAGCLFLLRRRK